MLDNEISLLLVINIALNILILNIDDLFRNIGRFNIILFISILRIVVKPWRIRINQVLLQSTS
jgi:hypothetical protein